jgi:hypothetical protein
MGAQREIGWVINMGDRVVVLDSGVSSTVEWDVVSWRTRVWGSKMVRHLGNGQIGG